MDKLRQTPGTSKTVVILFSFAFTFPSLAVCSEDKVCRPRALTLSQSEESEQSQFKSFISRQLKVSESNWNRGRSRMKEIEEELLRGNTVIDLNFWDLFYPSFACPFTTERLGRTGDGGKWICGFEEQVRRKSPCLIYSFGIGYETSFEEEILERSNCTIRMFDHTIPQPPALVSKYPERATWSAFGISGNDSGSLRTLKSLLNSNQNEFIDILKMDVEGAEFDSLTRILKDFPGVLPFSQLLVEIHLNEVPPEEKPKFFLPLWKSWEEAGLRPFQSELNYLTLQMGEERICTEFSFLNIKVEPFKF